METTIEKFDNATAVVEISAKLRGIIVNSKDARQTAYDMAKKANSLKIKVDNRRKELTGPFREEKSTLIKEHEEALETLNMQIKTIDDLAREKLIDPLAASILVTKNGIIAWDTEQKRIKAEEEAKILAEQKAEEDRINKEKEALDSKALEEEEARQVAERAKLKAIEDEKNRKLKEADNSRGIEAERKKKSAEKEAVELKIRAEEGAVEAKKKAASEKDERDRLTQEATAKAAKDAMEAQEELNAKKKGRMVTVVSWNVKNLNVVPNEFINKTINKLAVESALDNGERLIFGIDIIRKQELKFQ